MCGILGLFSIKNQSIDVSERNVFGKTLELLKHRGPDETQTLYLKQALLGYKRLAIVGGKEGSQPIRNEEGSVYLMCNGEIYNYKELRKELKSKHTFRTTSDCEIIVHLYEECGMAFVKRIKGQFSVVIYDEKKKLAIFARDRFGIHPLYYAKDRSNLLVASEIKSLLPMCPWICKLDSTSLAEGILLYGPTSPRTYFKDVFQVPPAHLVVFKLTSGDCEAIRYWQPIFGKNNDIDVNNFMRLLKLSVHRRLQGATSQVGVYFSGGIDSSTVSALTKIYSKKLPLLLSIQFHDPIFDESTKQISVKNHLKLKQIKVFGDDKKMALRFDKVIWHLETPLSRMAPIPLYELSKVTHKEKVKYVLCGEGADEILLGYPVFFSGKSSVEAKFIKQKTFEKLFAKKYALNFENIFNSYIKNIKVSIIFPNKYCLSQFIEIDTKLSRYLLSSQGDRMSMSHSVEQRFPFLDEDLVDYALSIDPKAKIRNHIGKIPLRLAMKGILPAETISSEKQGYLTPWLLLEDILNNHRELIIDRKLFQHFGYFDFHYVNDLYNQYLQGKRDEIQCAQLLFVISTHQLHRTFFD